MNKTGSVRGLHLIANILLVQPQPRLDQCSTSLHHNWILKSFFPSENWKNAGYEAVNFLKLFWNKKFEITRSVSVVSQVAGNELPRSQKNKNPQLKLFSFFLSFFSFYQSKSFCFTDRRILTQSEVGYDERAKRGLNEAEGCKKV